MTVRHSLAKAAFALAICTASCVDYPTLVIGTNLTLMQPLHASAPTRAILAQATLCRWCLESRWLSQPAEPMCMWLLRLLCILYVYIYIHNNTDLLGTDLL